ncbi:MAG: phage portal protein [Hominimerdicola sp.]
MKFAERFRNFFTGKPDAVNIVKMVTENNSCYVWNGKIYENDIVRSCVNAGAKAVGKMVPKHIRTTGDEIEVNPDPYIKILLKEPNPYMSQQQLQEKMARTLFINRNAFALVIRDENGFPIAIYPINSSSAEALYDENGRLYLRFNLNNGKIYTFPYSDIIHLRLDYYDNELFGTPIIPALEPLMQMVGTTDKGMIDAIKNSSVIRWLLKFTTSMRPEDIKKATADFSKNYLSTESGGFGVAGIDSKMDATQIKTDDYVPNSAQMDKTTQRIYSIFCTNEKIIQSRYTEDERNAYHEENIEPIGIDFSNEYSRALFSRKDRENNGIVFESFSLEYASIKTKLELVQYLDRGVLTPNEVRALFNYAPVEGGDTPLLRKDTGKL